MEKLKVLVCAYACSPFQGSEPGVGWGFVSELAKHHELWVIVEEEKFRSDIERYLANCPELLKSVHFLFIPKQRNRLLRKIWPPSYYWYYRRWHKEAFLLAQSLHREVGFHLVHQLTMVGFREPGYLWKLGIPFVWGPVGGLGYFPWRFIGRVGLYGGVYYAFYNFINWIQSNYYRRPLRAAISAGSGLIAMSSENATEINKNYGRVSKLMVAVGPPRDMSEHIVERKPSEPLRIVWTGLLIPRKALNLGLQALSQVSGVVDFELHIIGDGPLKNKWVVLAKDLGLLDKCFFHGRVPREQVLSTMKSSHLHLFTSLREGTPSVIVEAGAMSLPTVCFDCSGMSDMVDDSSGIKVSLGSSSQVIDKLAAAIKVIAENEELRQRLAKGAYARALSYGWDEKINDLNKIYSRRISEATLRTQEVD